MDDVGERNDVMDVDVVQRPVKRFKVCRCLFPRRPTSLKEIVRRAAPVTQTNLEASTHYFGHFSRAI